ncbi:class E sortase [Pseudonocardia sp. EC080610-09]|uniref:class E sortase n=1 Tax=Pseudonocardia sp. EC080610-09 TaxID=1688404 RepID=UPI001438A17D|nr:class E sortase [Pseudonocardia sp. EC080610-09]
MVPTTARPGPARSGRAWRRAGAALLVLALVLAGGLGYSVWRDHTVMAQGQQEAGAELVQAWAGQQAAPARSVTAGLAEGDPFARIQIPRFGDDWSYTILQGTSQDVLARGPGHYPRSADPGELGNFALAGHRVGHAGVFDRAAELQPCDPIVVTTATTHYTYKVLPYPGADATDCDLPATATVGRQIVTPDASEVLNPVPGQAADTPPAAALITLTTCHPRYAAQQRMIIHGVLVAETTLA